MVKKIISYTHNVNYSIFYLENDKVSLTKKLYQRQVEIKAG